MGNYSYDLIYGIRIYNFNADDYGNTLYEEKYDEIMSNEQMREAYLFYNQLNDKNNIHFKIYTECASTMDLNKQNYMNWYPMTLTTFLEKFGIQ